MPPYRHPLIRRPAMVLAAVAVLALYAFCGHLFLLNRRISRELDDARWREPVRIYSNAVKSDEPLLLLYGQEWRATTPVELSELSEEVVNAFVAAEDARFRRHFGIDPIGIARAMFQNLRSGRISQGASTINQQLVRSMFLSTDRTYRRKIVEMVLAVLLDFRMSKDEILEAYLNLVYLGHARGEPVLGINEAARLYFSKPATKLSIDDAALIAAIIRAPNRDTPEKRPELAQRRRDAILDEMKGRKWIDDDAYERAKAKPVRFQRGRLTRRPYTHFISALRDEISSRAGEEALRLVGSRVVTTLDPDLQESAEKAVTSGTATLRRRHTWLREQDEPLQTAVLTVDAESGGIRALVSGSDPAVRQFDRTRLMRRQPGSAFKTFVYLAAIDSRKFTNSSLLRDSPIEVELAGGRVWRPHNYDERFRGRVTLREAFEKSLNVPTVRVAQEIDNGRVIRLAKKLQVESDLPDIPALPLGVAEMSMRELVSAYTIFPNLGEQVEPHLLVSLHDSGGKELYRYAPKRRKVVDASSAYVMHTLLRGVVVRGTASRLRQYGLSHAAGKTGTTSDYRDAWFVGYTPSHVTAVWVGFDRGKPLRLSSAEAALPIWGSHMRSARSKGAKEIERPGGVVERQVDPESGFIWAEGCPGPVREWYLSGTAPSHRCPRGVVGKIIRSVLFDEDSFDEPPAITFEKFRRWTEEVDRERQRVERRLDRLRRLFD